MSDSAESDRAKKVSDSKKFCQMAIFPLFGFMSHHVAKARETKKEARDRDRDRGKKRCRSRAV